VGGMKADKQMSLLSFRFMGVNKAMPALIKSQMSYSLKVCYYFVPNLPFYQSALILQACCCKEYALVILLSAARWKLYHNLCFQTFKQASLMPLLGINKDDI
jgi:hypothetical protein